MTAHVRITLIFLIFVAAVVSLRSGSAADSKGTIIVGMRADARPFVYSGSDEKSNEAKDIAHYRGFISNVCRTVLHDLVREGPFEGFELKVRRIESAKGRFELLESGEIDLLCGPNSIDNERLRIYNSSYPLFLSGITYAYTLKFPESDYCDHVVGSLADTTASTNGLRIMSQKNALLRFDQELDEYFESYFNPAKFKPKRYKTDNCPNGYELSPVYEFHSHSEALKKLCSGKLLYYVADVDIIKAQLKATMRDPDLSEECRVKVEPYTLTREVYGLFFRKAVAFDPTKPRPKRLPRGFDALFFSEFNNILLRKMQGDKNVLERAFEVEFPDFQMSGDLAEFFRSMKITKGWRQ